MNFFTILFFLAAAAAASAQTFEVSAVGGLSRPNREPIGSLADTGGRDDDVKMKGDIGYGGRFTWNTKGYYGQEFGYIRTRGTLFAKIRDGSDVTQHQSRITIQQAFYDFLMYMMPNGEHVRPFIAAGAAIHQYGEPNIAGWTRGKSRNWGVNYGGGLKFVFGHALIRIDARHYLTGKPYDLTFPSGDTRGLGALKGGGLLGHLEGTVGIGFTF